jgi:cell wall-associated NlpC family hydrolase
VIGAVILALTTVTLVDGRYVAAAEPAETTVEAVAQLARTEQSLHDVGAAIQQRQEDVNRAIADVATARDNAAGARARVVTSQRALTDANAAIDSAQQEFDRLAVSTYIDGPSSSFLTVTTPQDVIDTAAQAQSLSEAFLVRRSRLDRARIEQANEESAARSAQQEAANAATAAEQSQTDAVAALTAAREDFGAQQQRLVSLTAMRDTERMRLGAASARPVDWDMALGVRPPAVNTSEWDTTLPMVPSANVASDPLAVVNSVLRIASTSAQTTADLGRTFLSRIGINLGGVSGADGSGFTNGAIPRVYGRQAAEYVIQRALSQRGVPYSWGGGNASGPSRGIDSGAGTVGFDCSGIVLYAFAGVGIKLPHYSGSQYNTGRKVPAAQMRRGDVIFYGPNASQHEALYLGQGMMLEAPFTGSDVHVSPVRTSGMTPFVTRFIEF